MYLYFISNYRDPQLVTGLPNSIVLLSIDPSAMRTPTANGNIPNAHCNSSSGNTSNNNNNNSTNTSTGSGVSFPVLNNSNSNGSSNGMIPNGGLSSPVASNGSASNSAMNTPTHGANTSARENGSANNSVAVQQHQVPSYLPTSNGVHNGNSRGSDAHGIESPSVPGRSQPQPQQPTPPAGGEAVRDSSAQRTRRTSRNVEEPSSRRRSSRTARPQLVMPPPQCRGSAPVIRPAVDLPHGYGESSTPGFVCHCINFDFFHSRNAYYSARSSLLLPYTDQNVYLARPTDTS